MVSANRNLYCEADVSRAMYGSFRDYARVHCQKPVRIMDINHPARLELGTMM